MDLQYGIAVTNKYALFIDEDEDPLEILRQKEEEAKNLKKDDKKTTKSKQSKKTAVVAEVKPKQPEQPAAKKDEKSVLPRQNERGGGRAGRGRELRENDGSRPLRRQSARDTRDFKGDENVPPEFRERREGGMRRDRGDREPGEGGFERGGGRSRGGGRGRGRGSRGGPRPESARGGFGAPGDRPRREFDRHSGTDKTGVKAVDKREGGGSHNWGSYRDEIEEQAASPSSNPADESGEWANSPVENAENPELNESGEAGQPKEDDSKEMTLDEWKKMQEQRRVKASFNIRKAGEGVDTTQWKKGTAYQKKHEEGSEEEDSEEDEEDDDRHGHRKQIVTDIRITFADNPRRGGRGGRRGGRAPGGRGGPRGGGGRGFAGPDREERPSRGRGPREMAPRFDDETDFPSLVKSEA